MRQRVSGPACGEGYIGSIAQRSLLPIMAKKIPLYPKHPERVCWGCDRYCQAGSLSCGNGSDRTPHPIEMLGEDWLEYGDWGFDAQTDTTAAAQSTPR
ncbi:hypothetical protein PUN4_900044 [Paraburkholderia unamae]|nr:hypothetical protein PUN4_900044 [Paraburkholderia unamae]